MSKHVRVDRFLTRAGVLAVLVAAWLTSQPAAAQANTGTPVKIGSLGHSLGFLQLDVAEAKGWLQTPRLRGEVVYFKAGRDSATALLDGSIGAAVLGIDHAITGQQQGVPIRQVALLNRLPGWILVVAKNLEAEVKSVEDLRKRKLGVSAPGSATHILLTYVLQKHGVPAEEVTIVKAGVDTLPEIMAQGGIDAGMALEPFGSSLVAEGKAFPLVDFRSAADVQKHLGTTYPVTALLVRQDVIDQHPEAVQDLTTALVWASRWLKEASADDVLRLLPSDDVSEPEVWRRSFEGYRDVFTQDGRNDPEGIRAVIAAQAAFDPEFDPGSVGIAALYNDRFWEEAVKLPLPGEAVEVAAEQPQQGESNVRWILLVVVLVALLGLAVFLVGRSRRPQR